MADYGHSFISRGRHVDRGYIANITRFYAQEDEPFLITMHILDLAAFLSAEQFLQRKYRAKILKRERLHFI